MTEAYFAVIGGIEETASIEVALAQPLRGLWCWHVVIGFHLHVEVGLDGLGRAHLRLASLASLEEG